MNQLWLRHILNSFSFESVFPKLSSQKIDVVICLGIWLELTKLNVLIAMQIMLCNLLKVWFDSKKNILIATFILFYTLFMILLFFLVSTLLQDCSLCWDHWSGTWRLHLTRPCLYVVHRNGVEPLALRRVLIWVERWIVDSDASPYLYAYAAFQLTHT